MTLMFPFIQKCSNVQKWIQKLQKYQVYGILPLFYPYAKTQ